MFKINVYNVLFYSLRFKVEGLRLKVESLVES